MPGNATWRMRSAYAPLSSGAVHVWRMGIDASAAEWQSCLELLTPDELDRLGRFRFSKDRARFVAARGLLRRVLASYLNAPPDCLRFAYNAYGKPMLAGREASSNLSFNLSHSAGTVLLAVACGRALGIDVEHIDPRVPCADLAQRFFSPREYESWHALPIARQTRAFFACWTRKEAYVKALGTGVSLPLDSFDVSVSPDEPARLLCDHGERAAASLWSLRDLHTGPEYAASLAVEGSGWELACREWAA